MDQVLGNTEKFLPAAGKHWMISVYDPFTRFFGVGKYYNRLLDCVHPSPGLKVLDVGCGTGTLGNLLKRRWPTVDFTGVDPDPKALAIAARKLERFRQVTLEQGMGHRLPFAGSSFDIVVSSFVFHHMDMPVRLATSREVRRVLNIGGSFHVIDTDWNSHGVSARHSLREILLKAGFSPIEKWSGRHLLFGNITMFSAT